MSLYEFKELSKACFTYPAIDNHTHPLLKEAQRNAFPFEGLLSEALGDALTEDSIHTLACYRATKQLAELFGCENDWAAVKAKRESMNYKELCDLCMSSTGIQCLLLDDLFDGDGICEDLKWHDQYASAPTRRIVRIEVVAQEILKGCISQYLPVSISSASSLLSKFSTLFDAELRKAVEDPSIVGFKSVACYRTGLDVSPRPSSLQVLEESLMRVMTNFVQSGKLRLADKHFNDYVVRLCMEVAGKSRKPVQFHTGLGDNDLTLTRASAAHLQPLIAAYPNTLVVLLHSSYPYTREAGYLTSVYKNVYLDFGEIFPFLSKEGQRNVVRQVLELTPTSKILWSTDGHFWPETYYLGTLQAREVLYEVLAENVKRDEVTEKQAVEIVQRALFENSNKLYQLDLQPDLTLGERATDRIRAGK